MSLTDKYATLLEMARSAGNVTIEDRGNVIAINGSVPDEAAKQRLWDEFNRLDPDYRSGEILMDIQAEIASELYTVQPGDSLSKIAKRYEGVTWKEIFDANRDQLDNPDLIHPGQVLKIPAS